MAVNHPCSRIVSDHVCVKSASSKYADLVHEATGVVEDHAMPVRRCLTFLKAAATSNTMNIAEG